VGASSEIEDKIQELGLKGQVGGYFVKFVGNEDVVQDLVQENAQYNQLKS
jgi:hypothetical protein